jgi:hypothetical protein
MLLVLLIVLAGTAAYFAVCGVAMAPGWLLYTRLENHRIARGAGVMWMVLAWLAVQALVMVVLGFSVPNYGPGQP